MVRSVILERPVEGTYMVSCNGHPIYENPVLFRAKPKLEECERKREDGGYIIFAYWDAGNNGRFPVASTSNKQSIEQRTYDSALAFANSIATDFKVVFLNKVRLN